jgi:hypothetical protein
MKNMALVLGFFLSLNAYSQVIFDSVIVKQSTELEGGRAEDLYDALTDISDADCNNDGCKQSVSMAYCTRMAQPIELTQCTISVEAKNNKNEPVVNLISSTGKHARNLMDAIIAVTHPECAEEAGISACTTKINSMTCERSGPWYWRSYKCALEL